MNRQAPLLLAILDGWGFEADSPANAISIARTPNMDGWMQEFPFTTLVAHNGLVGLPEGQMGNSEVGHLNIGAGRIVYQEYTRINKAIESGDFYRNQTLVSCLKQIGKNGCLHLFGLLSDGGVHSHVNHLLALLRMAKENKIEKTYIHCFMDGRDTPPKSGEKYMHQLLDEIENIGCGHVASVAGRYYAMDRDNRWNRIRKAWEALVDGQGETASNGLEAVRKGYARGETDEFILPTVVLNANNKPITTVKDGDTVIFFNFRADRVKQLCRAFIEKNFNCFAIKKRPVIRQTITFTEYDADFNLPVVFPPVELKRILGEEISRNNLKQLRIAETEKYAHVTYFFNGGIEKPYKGEDRVLIESPRDVKTYDQKPEMSAYEITESLLDILKKNEASSNPYSLIVLNFANCDMVGHTGIIEATVKACETVDNCLGKIRKYMALKNGIMIITADHGNAEIMIEKKSVQPLTSHTLSPVPLILVSDEHKLCTLKSGGALKDIAPTILSLLHLEKPQEMEGENLIISSQRQ